MYVDSHGRRTRAIEMQFPTQPLYVATMQIYTTMLFLSFSATHIDVFDLLTTQWVQTINLRSTRPLQLHGER